jgi:hypothetical protein
VGWIVKCENILGGISEDTCTNGNAKAEIINLAGPPEDVDAVFTEGLGSKTNCSIGGAELGDVTSEVLIFTQSGAALAVSEG